MLKLVPVSSSSCCHADASSKNLKSMIDLFDLARNSHRLLVIVLTIIKIDKKSVLESLTNWMISLILILEMDYQRILKA